MKIKVLTLFPEMFDCLKSSVIGRAIDGGKLQFEAVDIRAYSKDRHHKCDDYPFGGGAGMVMMPQPIFDAFQAVDPERKSRRIYMSPKGRRLSDSVARELASENRDLILLCGHYEGVDQRVIELCIDDELSIGDYVLTGGELAAMVTVDALARFLPGVLGCEQSSRDESFASNRLEYPQYTRPAEFMGIKVPDVLLSGHHANVDKWRREQADTITSLLRPDIMEDKK
ncbi:MAG: tRNA (guanosine(37)-N1)-methyltransferase TrmD [Clostridia bacterium]|nr:tRNA (guanosine(37)-N1)-methyltransferase TrmD [Clostridia bacterium]